VGPAPPLLTNICESEKMKGKLLRIAKHTRSTHCASWTLPRSLGFRDTWRGKVSVRIALLSACDMFVVFSENSSYLKVSCLCITFAWVDLSWWTWRVRILRFTHWTVNSLINKCIYFLFRAVYFHYQRHEPRPVKYMGSLNWRLILKFSQTCFCN
jgi:hypothetical protein